MSATDLDSVKDIFFLCIVLFDLRRPGSQITFVTIFFDVNELCEKFHSENLLVERVYFGNNVISPSEEISNQLVLVNNT